MTTWLRQYQRTHFYRMPWHLESLEEPRAKMLGLYLAKCGTTFSAEDRGIDQLEDPPLDDRCPVCQGSWMRGDAG